MNFLVLETQILSRQDREHGSGAGADEISAAERTLGVRLAGSYRKFLERFGWLGLGTIEIYGLGRDVPKHLNLVEITQSERAEMHPRLRSDLVPVMNDGGGNLYCIVTTAVVGADMPVVFWDHDLDCSQEPETIAQSFEQWLSERLYDV